MAVAPRSHYDLLGLAPDAPATEIRRAYMARARRIHPDHRPPAERHQAAAEMAVLNEAWRVLGDPARRADYDVTIGVCAHPDAPAARGDAVGGTVRPAGATAARGPAPGRTDGSARPATAAEAAGRWQPAPQSYASEHRGCGPVAWIVFVGLVVAGLVGAVAAYVATVPDVEAPEPTAVVDDTIEVGDCVVVVPSASGVVAYERSCTGRVSGRVAAVVAYPAPCPAGTSAASIVSERTTLCLVAP